MCFLWVWDSVFRDEVADGHERVEALSDRPWESFSFRLVLYVTGCHVDSENVAWVVNVSRTDLEMLLYLAGCVAF